MRIEHVAISNFRGIRQMEWHVGGRTICLVGPGDSTKTTILDALELALLPSRNAPIITDSDFFGHDRHAPFFIEVTISEPPDELIAEDKYGRYLRGYVLDRPVLNDPTDDSVPVLTIRFEVGSDLESHWLVVKPSQPEPKSISAWDRERFGLARLGEDSHRDLTWAQGSALTRITEQQRVSRATLADAGRAAADALGPAALKPLDDAARLAQKAIIEFGVGCSELRPALDMHSVRLTTGALALHDGPTPLRVAGLGSRRLACLAIHHRSVGQRGIILIDEVEHGLEPHRVRQLLKRICPPEQGSADQVILTTHSPTPIFALPADSLRIVKSDGGTTLIGRPNAEIQGLVRSNGHALLGHKVLVCEGKTEEALCRAFDDVWTPAHGGKSLAYQGVVAIDGNGRTHGPQSALEFHRLSYDVLYFGDSDQPISPDTDSLRRQGVAVVLWPGNHASEERIATDLPCNRLDEFVATACQHVGEDSVLDQIGHRLGTSLHSLARTVDAWKEGRTEQAVRDAIGKAAKAGAWFKNLNAGLALGQIVAAALPDIQESPLAQSMREIEAWVYA